MNNLLKSILLTVLLVAGSSATHAQGYYYMNKEYYYKYLQDSIKLLNKYHKVSDLESERLALVYGHLAALENMNAESYFDSVDAQNKVGGLTLPMIKKLNDHFLKFQNMEHSYYSELLANMEKMLELQRSQTRKSGTKKEAKK